MDKEKETFKTEALHTILSRHSVRTYIGEKASASELKKFLRLQTLHRSAWDSMIRGI